MGSVYGEINSRADFFRVLGEATDLAARLAAQQPGFAVAQVILKQLQAMKGWTENGREPATEERGRISIGVIALREFENAEGPLRELGDKLSILNNYFDDWPTDEKAASATDDDFWDDDDDDEE
jgi:hypothetical protein